MRYEQIEINRLGAQGEVKRRIRCLAGHITVFRANDPGLLKLFANGLLGVTIPGERFSVLLDNTPFNADIHARIGFGEKFRTDDVTQVKDYLVGAGVPADAVESLLLSHGLGGLAAEACRNLSPEQDRMVRLLGIAYSDHGVVLLNDPFTLVPESWHNTFARDLSNFAWQKRAIVVVPQLTNRPDDWIENEIVSRVQLETPRKRTIGFGGGGDDPETQKLIEALRRDVAGGAAGGEKGPARPAPQHDLLKGGFPAAAGETASRFALPRFKLPSGPIAILGTTFVIAMAATIMVLAFQEMPPPVTTAMVQQSNAHENTPLEFAGQKPKTVLEGYPEDISSAVTLAFTDPDAAIKANQAASQVFEPAKINRPEAAPFAQPSRSSFPASVGASDEESEPSPEDDAELARRREEIRQRFIEAIQRQSAQQGE